MKDERNMEHYNRARKVIPSGLTSNFRKDDGAPSYFYTGDGARLRDLDGNEYVDFSLSYGPSILGHSNQNVKEALHRQIDIMYTNENNPLEAEAAELICKHVPCAEQVYFACSGTDAVANAFRVSRGFTKRNMIVRFKGHYNGWHDAFLGGITTDPNYPVTHPGELASDRFSQQTNTGGRGKNALSDSFLIQWNDLDALARLLEAHGKDIAAVHMEPIMINCAGCSAKPGYLEGVRELCTNHGVVLIFDEVITGFRTGITCAQGYLGITPDLTTLAKALGSGAAPVAAFCGKREIMDTIAKKEVICAGTYNGHPLSMTAVIATIKELERNNGAIYQHIERLGNKLAKGLREAFAEYDIPIILQGFPGAWCLSWSKEGTIYNLADANRQDFDNAKTHIFSQLMRKRGIMTTGRFYTSAAHTDEDIDQTLAQAHEVCKELIRS